MLDRLTKELRPERACEEDVLEAAAALPNADLLADMVERTTRREWIHGAETGRREAFDELGVRSAT